MKKIKILKKAICLVTTLTFVIGLSACSTKKDLFKEDDVLNYIPYYDNGNEANRKINISPEGARLFSEKNFYKVEDDELTFKSIFILNSVIVFPSSMVNNQISLLESYAINLFS